MANTKVSWMTDAEQIDQNDLLYLVKDNGDSTYGQRRLRYGVLSGNITDNLVSDQSFIDEVVQKLKETGEFDSNQNFPNPPFFSDYNEFMEAFTVTLTADSEYTLPFDCSVKFTDSGFQGSWVNSINDVSFDTGKKNMITQANGKLSDGLILSAGTTISMNQTAHICIAPLKNPYISTSGSTTFNIDLSAFFLDGGVRLAQILSDYVNSYSFSPVGTTTLWQAKRVKMSFGIKPNSFIRLKKTNGTWQQPLNGTYSLPQSTFLAEGTLRTPYFYISLNVAAEPWRAWEEELRTNPNVGKITVNAISLL